MGVLTPILVAAFSLAFAGAPPQKDDPARRAFERGRELYFKAEYAAALPLLQQAYELSGKRPSTVRALALCERALGKDQDALQHLREYRSATPPPPDTKEIDAVIADLEAHALEPTHVLQPIERDHEEEDFVWDAARGDDRAKTDDESTALVSQPPQVNHDEPIIERPLFWIVVTSVLAAAGAAVAVSVALTSGDDALYGGSQDRVLRR